MKIAVFTETALPNVNGVVRRLDHTIPLLQKAGDQILVFAPAGGAGRWHGAEVVHAPSIALPMYPEILVGMPHPGLARDLHGSHRTSCTQSTRRCSERVFMSPLLTVKTVSDGIGDYSVSLGPGIYSISVGGTGFPLLDGPTHIAVGPRASVHADFVVSSNLL